jgi:hypothetical protein
LYPRPQAEAFHPKKKGGTGNKRHALPSRTPVTTQKRHGSTRTQSLAPPQKLLRSRAFKSVLVRDPLPIRRGTCTRFVIVGAVAVLWSLRNARSCNSSHSQRASPLRGREPYTGGCVGHWHCCCWRRWPWDVPTQSSPIRRETSFPYQRQRLVRHRHRRRRRRQLPPLRQRHLRQQQLPSLPCGRWMAAISRLQVSQ